MSVADDRAAIIDSLTTVALAAYAKTTHSGTVPDRPPMRAALTAVLDDLVRIVEASRR